MKKVYSTPFFKIHGAGNDCLVFHGRNLALQGSAKKKWIQRISHRHWGIGSDQILEILSLKPLAIQVWNCDGSKAEMCGNGSRAFAYLALKESWISAKEKSIPIQVSGKPYELRKEGNGFALGLGQANVMKERALRLTKHLIPYTPVQVGNPHAVIFCTGKNAWKVPKDFSFQKYGAAIECHSQFPKKTNVEFVRKIRKERGAVNLFVEVWERGAGATLSCGSGAVAVAAAYRARTLGTSKKIKVWMNGYCLTVKFERENTYLSGPSEIVARGVFQSTR